MDCFENDYAVRIKDFSKMFNLSEKTPYELIKRYPDQFANFKKGRHTYIPASAVEHYVKIKRKEKGPAQVIVCYMRKGGVGKTTMLINLAVRACMYGNKVCIVDLDSQANSTRSFKVTDPKERDTFLNVFHHEITPTEAALHVRKNLHLIPANNKLTKLSSDIDAMEGFRQFIPFMDDLKSFYDLVLVDCGGLMDMTTFQALAASDKIISPAFPDEYSDEGLELTLEEIEKLKKLGFSPKHYIILNRIDPNFREKATRQYVDLFQDLYDNIAKTKIRKSQDIINSISAGSSIFESNYDSSVALEIESLYREIILEEDPKEVAQ